MTDTGPIEQHGGAVTIQTAPMLASAYRAVLCGIQRRTRDGVPIGDLQALARALRRAHDASYSRHKLADTLTAGACCASQHGDPLSVGEAAVLLGLSRRQVQRLAAGNSDLGGVRIGRTWALDRAAVLTLAQRKATT